MVTAIRRSGTYCNINLQKEPVAFLNLKCKIPVIVKSYTAFSIYEDWQEEDILLTIVLAHSYARARCIFEDLCLKIVRN